MKKQIYFTKLQRTKDAWVAALFLLPSFLFFALFKYYVLGYNLYLSFTSWNFFSPKPHFVGLKNFFLMFGDRLFWKVLGNTFYYSIGTTVCSIVLGLIFALLLFNRQRAFGGIFKTIFFIPNITTASAIAVLWIWIFDPLFGLSGQFFALLGKESPFWLTDVRFTMPVVISLTVWRSAGFAMLIFLSGLSNISSTFYEAAQIDGASWIQVLFKITLPLLSSTTFFLMITSSISAMQVFDIIAVMTHGGPFNSTTVLNLHVYQKAFGEAKAGYAAALSIVLFLIILSFTLLQKYISKKWVNYVA